MNTSSLALLIGIVMLLWSEGIEGKRRHGKVVARWGDKKGEKSTKVTRKGKRANGKKGGNHSSSSSSGSGSSGSSDSSETSEEDTGKKVPSARDKLPYVTKETFSAGGGTRTILEILQEDGRYAEFAKLVASQPEVTNILNDASRQLTLLVPSNVAVRNRGTLSDAARLLVILLYHVVEGVFSREELRDGSVRELHTCFVEDAGVFAKLPGGVAQVIALRNGLLTTGVQPDAKIQSEEPTIAKNGLIYQTDVMLIPPLMTPEGLEGTPYTGALEALLDRVYRRVGLTLFLPASGGPWPAGLGEQLTYRHAVEGQPVYWGSLWDGLRLTALDGSVLLVRLAGDQFMVNNQRIVRANMPTVFGVVHLVEGPLETLSKGELEKIAKSGAKEANKPGGGEKYVPNTSDKAGAAKGEAIQNGPDKDPTTEARMEAAKRNDGNGSTVEQRHVALSTAMLVLSILGMLVP